MFRVFVHSIKKRNANKIDVIIEINQSKTFLLNKYDLIHKIPMDIEGSLDLECLQRFTHFLSALSYFNNLLSISETREF